ncbi:MAG: sulfite exporter TauE/SafE family protein [Nocardioidaceae bacterium]|nr:sulfite exporter TauE/SafE family protein [Nocardioidaceae bacterium]NUS50074.1 sulfite exporter TauE/SafE family protein [Nocardioidaceae bacterium]
MTVVVLGVLALGIGVLVGTVGVGGVLLAPLLIAVGGLSAHAATATSTFTFMFTGATGTLAYGRRGVIPWAMLFRLSVGLVPAAYAGARVSAALPPTVILVALAAVSLLAGTHQVLALRRGVGSGADRDLTTWQLVLIGAVVGFGSALTGTGGPVLLVPLLLALGVAPVRAVAVSQVAQLPVVVPASIGFVTAGATDVRLGTVLGIAAACGVVAGSRLALQLPSHRLRLLVALACLGTGAFLLVRLVVA